MTNKSLIQKIIRWHKTFNNEEFKTKIQSIGFDYLGEGVFRETYGNGKIVIKILIGGDDQNKHEYFQYKKFKKDNILKYLVVPMYGYYLNGIGNSILIAAQAKPISINNPFGENYPAEKGFSDGFKIRNKTWHKIANIYYKVFNDLHDDNIMKFGKSIVMIDINSEHYNDCKKYFEKYSIKWKKLADFEKHKAQWDKQYKLAFS